MTKISLVPDAGAIELTDPNAGILSVEMDIVTNQFLKVWISAEHSSWKRNTEQVLLSRNPRTPWPIINPQLGISLLQVGEPSPVINGRPYLQSGGVDPAAYAISPPTTDPLEAVIEPGKPFSIYSFSKNGTAAGSNAWSINGDNGFSLRLYHRTGNVVQLYYNNAVLLTINDPSGDWDFVEVSYDPAVAGGSISMRLDDKIAQQAQATGFAYAYPSERMTLFATYDEGTTAVAYARALALAEFLVFGRSIYQGLVDRNMVTEMVRQKYDHDIGD